MQTSIPTYRSAYARLSQLFLVTSGMILLLTSACVIVFVVRQEPACYATSVRGLLTPLQPCKVLASETGVCVQDESRRS